MRVATKITLSPTSSGSKSTNLSFSHNGSNRSSPYNIPLSGTGVSPPAITVSPTSWNYGNVTVGSNSSKSFTLTNTGDRTLTGSVNESSDQFSITSGGGNFSLGPGAQKSITVRFAPTSSGSKSTNLSFSHNGSNRSSPYNIPLSGTGVSPAVEVTEPDAAIIGNEVPLTADLPADLQPEERLLRYRRTGEPDYQRIVLDVNGTLNAASIPAAFVTERGIEYFFQFRIGQTTITVPDTESDDFPFQLRIQIPELAAPGPFTPNRYRMISVPLDLDNPQAESVLDEYGPYDPMEWRLLRWNAAAPASSR